MYNLSNRLFQQDHLKAKSLQCHLMRPIKIFQLINQSWKEEMLNLNFQKVAGNATNVKTIISKEELNAIDVRK